MKKTISILVSLVLFVCFAIPAFAADDGYPIYGVWFHEENGTCETYTFGAIEKGSGAIYTTMYNITSKINKSEYYLLQDAMDENIYYLFKDNELYIISLNDDEFQIRSADRLGAGDPKVTTFTRVK